MNHYGLLGIVSACLLWTVSYGYDPPHLKCIPRTVYKINETVPETFTTGDVILSIDGLQSIDNGECDLHNFIKIDGDNVTLTKPMSSYCTSDEPTCNAVTCSPDGGASKITFPIRWDIVRTLEYNISTEHNTYGAHVPEMTALGTRVPLNETIKINFKDCHGGGPVGGQHLELVKDSADIPFSWGAVTNFNDLNVTGQIDYETQTEYMLPVIIKFDKFRATATTTIKVTVEDIDDNNPRFSITGVDAHYVLNLPEKNQTLVNVSLPVEPPIHAYDPDFGINMTIEYSITGQDKDGLFEMDSATGTISVTRAINMSEVNDFYKIFIEAAQTDNHNRATHAWVRVNVLDIDDHLPLFKPENYNSDITEHASSGTKVALLHVFDADEGDNANFTCVKFNGSLPVGIETIPNGCRVFVDNSAKFDREAFPNGVMLFEVGAMATLRGELGDNNASVTVTLIDINDNSPEFKEDKYSYTLTNKSKDSVIGQISATDADAGGNGNVTYVLMSSIVEKQECDETNEPELPFALALLSGDLTKTSDTPSCQSYRTSVQACDNPTNPYERRCTLAELTVTNTVIAGIQNLNQTVEIRENSRIGTFIEAVRCSGRDRTYTTDTTVFNIDNTGFITPIVVLDRENISRYDFRVEVQDKTSTLLCNVNVTVDVLDVNDNAPAFNKPSYSFNLPDSRVDGLIIGRVQATDIDEGENARISYVYHKQATSHFALNGTSGEISIQSAAAITACDVTTLLIVAKDNGNPQMESVTQVYIVCHDSNTSVPLSTPLSKQEIDTQKDTFENDISGILNMTVQITGIDDIGDSTGGRSRILLTAADPKVQQHELLEAVLLHFEAIRSLFYGAARETEGPGDDTSDKDFGAAEIALIAMGVVILVGTVLAIVIIHRQFNSHKRYKQLYESLTRNSSLYESQEIKVKMDDETSDYNGSVRSQDLGSMGTPRNPALATSAINPGFVHDEATVLGQTNLQASPTDPATNTTVKEVIESLERLSDRLEQEDLDQIMKDVEPSTTSDDVPLVEQADSIEDVNQNGDSSPVVYANVAMNKPTGAYVNVAGFGNARNSIDIPASESIQLTEMNVEAEINHDGTGDNSGDANDTEQTGEEPNPDYDVKQVRFHGEVLDADDNVLQPLKPDKVAAANGEAIPDDVTPEPDTVNDEDAPAAPAEMDEDRTGWVDEEMDPPIDTVPEQEPEQDFFFVEDALTHL